MLQVQLLVGALKLVNRPARSQKPINAYDYKVILQLTTAEILASRWL